MKKFIFDLTGILLTMRRNEAVEVLHYYFTYSSFFQHLIVKKHVNQDFRIASLPILQSLFFERVSCLILVSS